MAGRGAGVGGRKQPPTVSLSTKDGFGALVPHNFNGESLNWVITGLEWGDQLRRRSSGHRVRQAATVEVTQYTTTGGDELSVAKRNNTHGRRHTTHTVKKGESLMRIARDEYGTSDRWQDIATANNIHDPRHLRVGMRLKLPK
jgi:nucleoid-associated protein YgaU